MTVLIKLAFLLLVVDRRLNINAKPVLRYNVDSCDSLEPSFVDEKYSQFNIGINENDEENSDISDDSPKKGSNRNKPFEINISFDQYRRNRDYTVEIVAEKNRYFDAFMLQARGKDGDDGNATYVGQWVKTPKIARTINCLDYRRSAITDVGRPIQFGNLKFTWRSPDKDMGPVRFLGSVVFNEQYLILDAKINGSRIKNRGEIPYKEFPMELNGCGRDKGCFRYCDTRPKCPPEEAKFMVAIETEDSNENLDGNEVLMKIGGYLNENKTNYIGVGLSRDSYRLKNSDVVACVRDGNSIQSEHYLLEDVDSTPHRHKLKINLAGAGVDSETGFTWCSFTRNIEPKGNYDLDLRRHFYQIYLWGEWNVSESRPMIAHKSRILNSGVRLNASEPFSEIVFTGGHSLGSNRLSQNGYLFLTTTFILLRIIYP